MKSDGIFDLAGIRLAWLAERRAVVAENIANASTPGYRTREVAPFAAQLAAAGGRATLATTSQRHIASSEQSPGSVEVGATSGSTVHSGNGVSLDLELHKAGEVARAHLLATGVVRAFHRLSIAATKS